ncbi:MAG: hypothetical protein ACFFDF_06260 [Candidatus Odinarchaeota archaeon]
MDNITDVDEIKHLVCLKCGWGLPIVPRDRFLKVEQLFRKQHEIHPLTVLTTSELYDLAEKRAELRKYANTSRSWAEVNKNWTI